MLVEGGPEIMGSFVREQLFDEFVIFRAPLILGGRGSLSVVGGPDPRALADAVPMRRVGLDDSATLRYGLPDASEGGVEVYARCGPRANA
jgi:riboflavin biosynthesis pyrimidine reductase